MTDPQTVADVLDAAADLLEKPKAWTQFATARASNRKPVSAVSDKAVCFCAGGAIVRAAGGVSQASNALRTLLFSLPEGSIADFNDEKGRTQSEVVAALRAAATSARQGETK